MNYTRNQDEAVEKMCAQRIDQWYRQQGIDFERATDEKRQFKGIDLVVHGKTKDINIDEKAKFHGLEDGKPLDSVSFEVCRKCKHDSIQLGWFVDKDNETDAYCFLLPKLKLNDVIFLKKTVDYHFTSSMDVLFVQKSDVVSFVLKQKTMLFGECHRIQSIDDIVEFAEQMIQYDMRHMSKWGNSFWMVRSTWLPEQPVNVIIPFKTLCSFPHSRYITI